MHLSRLNAQKVWALKRKGKKWVIRVKPGPHPLNQSLPLNEVVKKLSSATNAKEAKTILNKGVIKVDGIVRKEPRFALGLMDIIEVSDLDKSFIILFNKKGKLFVKEIGKNKKMEKTCKITGKTAAKKGKIQINLFDGKNMLLDAKAGREYKTNDSLVIELEDKRHEKAKTETNKKENKKEFRAIFHIKKHLKFEKNALIYISGGKYIGNTGILTQIGVEGKEELVRFKIDNKKENEEVETQKKNVFVIDKEFKAEI